MGVKKRLLKRSLIFYFAYVNSKFATKAAEKAGDARLVRYITSGEWDEEEAQYARKDVEENYGREKESEGEENKEKSILGHSESRGWGDISFTDERGRVRLLSEVVRGGEKELKKINNFATEFYTTPKNADQSY